MRKLLSTDHKVDVYLDLKQKQRASNRTLALAPGGRRGCTFGGELNLIGPRIGKGEERQAGPILETQT
jgi:hypothetical protein